MKYIKNISVKSLAFKIISFAAITLPLYYANAQGTTGTAANNCNQCGASGAAEAGKICNPISVCSLMEFIRTILEGVIKIGMPVIALALVYCGFLFVSARGNAKELETAKKSLTYTLIGAAVLLGSWALAKLIAETISAL